MISRPSGPPSSARCGSERTSAASPAMSAVGIYGKLATIMSSFSGGGSGVSRSPRKNSTASCSRSALPWATCSAPSLLSTASTRKSGRSCFSVSATAPEPVPISTTVAVVEAPATARCFPPCLRAAKVLTSPAAAGSAAIPVAASSGSGSAAAGSSYCTVSSRPGTKRCCTSATSTGSTSAAASATSTSAGSPDEGASLGSSASAVSTSSSVSGLGISTASVTRSVSP